MNKATELLKAAGTFYIATVEGDQPRLRPFGAVGEINGKTYLSMNNTKKVYAQLIANPKSEICAMVGPTWFRIQCDVIRDNTDEARAEMLKQNESLGGMYKLGDGIFEVFYLDNVKGTVESFSDPKEEF